MAPSSLILIFLICFISKASGQALSPTLAPYQSPPSPVVLQSPTLAPTPARKVPSIVTILQKPGYFTALIRLLKTTGMGDQIDSQIKHSNGLTFFAPTDSAFSKLKPGLLNSFTNEQQVELMQFHVIPTFLSTTQFQTVSNPLFTLADGSNDGKFPLNVTINGDEIDLSTGIDNATITNTIYSDAQLVVYQVDRVLLPKKIFIPDTPPPAPTPVEAPAVHPKPEPVNQRPQPVVTAESSAANGFAAARVFFRGVTSAAAAATVIGLCFA